MKRNKAVILNMESAPTDVHALLGIRELIPKRKHTNVKIALNHLPVM